MPDGTPRRSWYRIVNAAGGAEIWLYDEVGLWGITARDFLADLKAVGAKPIALRVNSPGGDVFDGISIYNGLRRHPAKITAHIDGVAASIASVICMAAHEIRAAGNSVLMVHDPTGVAIGRAEDMDRMAETLRMVKSAIVAAYRRSGKPDAEIEAMMSDETWLSAEDARRHGFVDHVDEPIEIAARFDLSRFSNVPANVRAAMERRRPAQGGAMDPITLDRPDETPAPPAPAPDVTAALRSAYKSAATLGLEIGAVDELLDSGVDVRDVPSALIDLAGARDLRASAVQRIFPAGSVRVVRDETETRSARIIDALHSRIVGKTPPEHSREFAAMRLADLADLTGHGSGDRGWFSPRASGQHGTTDFPNLLGTSAQRSLMDFYAVQASPMLQLARRNDAADFRERQRVRLGEAPALQQVLEHGEVTHGSAGEQAESIQLATYARIFALSRQAVVNDDLGAFSDQLRWWATAVASLEATKLVAVLSQVMSDGSAIFHANHSNLAGSGGAISVATISAGRVAMRSQTGIGGTEIVGAPPRYLLTGAAKETEAQQIVASLMPAVLQEVNPFSGALTVLTEPRISGNAWYLFADPAVLPVIEYAYLSRSPGPQLETRQGFEVLGSEFRVLLDFAAGAVDFRGGYKNPGA